MRRSESMAWHKSEGNPRLRWGVIVRAKTGKGYAEKE